jgi:hypothetical protein
MTRTENCQKNLQSGFSLIKSTTKTPQSEKAPTNLTNEKKGNNVEVQKLLII